MRLPLPRRMKKILATIGIAVTITASGLTLAPSANADTLLNRCLKMAVARPTFYYPYAPGHFDACVQLFQRMLRDSQPKYGALVADGLYGLKSIWTVMVFQNRDGIGRKYTRVGYVDHATWCEMLEDYQSRCATV